MGIGIYELFIMLFLLGFIPFIFAFVDILESDFMGNSKLVRLLAEIFVPLIGSIAYFVVGRKQKIIR